MIDSWRRPWRSLEADCGENWWALGRREWKGAGRSSMREGEVLGRVGFLHVGLSSCRLSFSVLVFSPAHRCTVNSGFVLLEG
jgi:hypothetical protein